MGERAEGGEFTWSEDAARKPVEVGSVAGNKGGKAGEVEEVDSDAREHGEEDTREWELVRKERW